MKVNELIKQLQAVKNQNARVDIIIPYEIENDTGLDLGTSEFEIHDSHAMNENDEDMEYIELYSTKTLGDLEF